MSRYNFDRISLHPEIIIEIYQHLAFDDQLRLSRVNGYLRSVFESYIWKEKYVTLKLFERINECVVSNESDMNRLCLNLKELPEFLNTYAANVRHLYMYEGMDELTQGLMIASGQLDIRQFRNLQSLRYYDMKVPLDHLKQLAELYPQLQELQLISCIYMAKDFNAVIKDIVPQLRNLKIFSITGMSCYQLKYENFCKIISQRPMECLKLKALIEPDKTMKYGEDRSIFAHSYNLRELSIQTWFDPEKWSHNYPSYLGIFKSLVILNLEIADGVTDTVLTTIAETCTELEQFSLRFTTFREIQNFSIPPKVSSLSLHSCNGISHTNLRQILTQCQIRKFYSVDTWYGGEFEAFQISPLIESLNVDGIPTEEFKSAYENNEHLKELTWYCEWSYHDIVTAESLVSCKNLHTLDMQDSYLSIDTLTQLLHLNMLIVPFLCWYDVKKLLKHPSLNDLCITFDQFEYNRTNIDEFPEGLWTTNIRQIEIPLYIFEMAISFWLELFTTNKTLKRIRCTFDPSESYEMFLKNVINHANFPRSLKTISLCGFTINCNDFRSNIDVTIKKLQHYTDSRRYLYNDERPCIILERPTNKCNSIHS